MAIQYIAIKAWLFCQELFVIKNKKILLVNNNEELAGFSGGGLAIFWLTQRLLSVNFDEPPVKNIFRLNIPSESH